MFTPRARKLIAPRPRGFVLVVALTVACSGTRPVPTPIAAPTKQAAAPAEQLTSVEDRADAKRWTYRHVHIEKDDERSRRSTYTLAVAGDRATMVIVHEHNGMSRLDQWTTPWTLVNRTALHGSYKPDGDGAVMELRSSDGKFVPSGGPFGEFEVHLTCTPRTHHVMAAGTRLIPKSDDPKACHPDPHGTWTLPAKVPVHGLSCSRDGSEEDPIETILPMEDLAFVTNPGIEWVQEQNGCFVFGQGFRQLP